MLKVQLAGRSTKEPITPARTAGDDWLGNLAPADRRYMERKLGIGKGKS